MLSLTVFTVLLAGASAFAPSQSSSQVSSTSLAANPLANELGAVAPLGFWDPLNTANGEKELFDQLREVELKHGRVAMLAVVGQLATRSGLRLPGYESYKANGFDALKEMPKDAWLWMMFSILILEIVMRDVDGTAEFKGDYRNGFDFGWDKQTDEWKEKKRLIELQNGRAAQCGILALMVHDYLGNLSEIGPF